MAIGVPCWATNVMSGVAFGGSGCCTLLTLIVPLCWGWLACSILVVFFVPSVFTTWVLSVVFWNLGSWVGLWPCVLLWLGRLSSLLLQCFFHFGLFFCVPYTRVPLLTVCCFRILKIYCAILRHSPYSPPLLPLPPSSHSPPPPTPPLPPPPPPATTATLLPGQTL